MKAILEFDLPEEQAEFTLAAWAGDLAACLQDVDNKLRNQLKHGHHEDAERVMAECRTLIGEVLHGLE